MLLKILMDASGQGLIKGSIAQKASGGLNFDSGQRPGKGIRKARATQKVQARLLVRWQNHGIEVNGRGTLIYDRLKSRDRAEIDLDHNRIGETSIAQVGSGEKHFLEESPIEIGTSEVTPTQIGSVEVGTPEVGFSEIGPFKFSRSERGTV
jgi:hypothetical protein